MSSPINQYAFDIEMLRTASENYYSRTRERERKKELMAEGRYDEVDSQVRIAKRVNRLISHLKEAGTGTQSSLPAVVRSVMDRGGVAPGEVNSDLLERVIGATRDFLGVAFLDAGLRANRTVGRIVTKLGGGRVAFGTGFLISKRLLLTNWHVLHSEDEAAISSVEFDYQIDLHGNPLSIQRFALDPKAFFVNDKTLDFAVVGVKEKSDSGKALTGYGFCPLIKEEGKITQGLDFLNIIQHPRGEMKQIVLRENKVVDLPENNDNVAHYEGDTEPGSSGSPVFNDQWEVIALHHQGVPRKDAQGNYLDVDGQIWREGDDPTRLDWVANEGIRISRIYKFLAKAKVREHEKALLKDLLNKDQSPATPAGPSESDNGHVPARPTPRGDNIVSDSENKTLASNVGGSVTVTIPLQITVSLGSSNGHTALVATPVTASEEFDESIKPDPDYSNRPGYDPDFTGFSAPLPKLTPSIKSSAVAVSGATGNPYELKYYHYSVIMNGARRIAFVSAVNLDAEPPEVFKREKNGKEKWFFDPRISTASQAGEELYLGNPLDRGHLSRRADAAWGDSQDDAKLANDDTFHFTNCSPQHEVFNQSSQATNAGLLLWGNLEDHIAKQAKDRKRVTVFNGPIFRSNDRKYRGVQLPKEFYKIVVFESEAGKPRALAFLLSQASLIKDLPEEDFVVGPYQPFQVPVREIEMKTKLDFGKLREYDPLENEENESFMEAATGAVGIGSPRDIVFD